MSKSWRPIGKNPITQNGTHHAKCHGIEFRNTGEVDVTIDGFWTLRPDEPKFFGLESCIDVYLDHEFRFEFATQAGVKKVEIVEIYVNNFNYGC